MKTQEKVLFLTNLAELLKSGISLRQGLTLAGREGDRHFQCYLQAVSRALRNGQDLASALQEAAASQRNQQPYFDPWAIALIRLAQTQGTLPETCQLLAEVTQTQAQWHRHYRSIHQSSLITVWSLLTLMAGVLNPNITAFLTPQFWLTSGVIALLLWFVAFSVPRYLGSALLRLGIHLPLMRQFIEAYALYYLAQLRLPLSCGMPIVTAVEFIQPQIPHGVMHKRLTTATRQLRRGQTLTESFQGKIPPLALEYLHAGEETGNVTEAWAQISRYYQEELDKGLSFVSSSLRLISLLAIANLIVIICIRGMILLLNPITVP